MKAAAAVIVGPTTLGALESSYVRAFTALNWDVHQWDPGTALASASRGGTLGHRISRFFHVEAWERKANLELLRLVDAVRPRLLLVIGTGGVRAGTLGQVRARCPGTQLFCMYPDSPHNLDAERILALPLFDRVTVSSPPWTDSLRRLGAGECSYLPFAADTTLHVAAASRDTHCADVAFVGTWRPERERFLEAFADLDLRIWGNEYWKTRTRKGSPLRRCWQGRRLRGDELGAVCASTRVMLNVMDPVTWPGPNMRTFEQAACRAFSLTTRTDAVLEIFTEGVDIECFADVAEARQKVEQAIGDERHRERIAHAGHQLVLRNHTYAHRAARLVEWLDAGTEQPT